MSEKFWVIIPAAGVGKRMQVNHPKQYLKISGKTVLEHTLNCFTQDSRYAGIVVVISEDDEYWPTMNVEASIPIYQAPGGSERCFSVLNGLTYLKSMAGPDDWVLVHDAARPCLRQTDVNLLVDEVQGHPAGGLLGLPVTDTLKFCGDNQIVERTVKRDGLWRALTPQMFRFEKLLFALQEGVQNPERITDESSAMELAGFSPVMVEGAWDNIKITHPQDLLQAELIMQNRSI